MTKIIAFAGRKQSGKTTCSEFVSNYFISKFGSKKTAKIYNFADPLKRDICINILGLTYDQCYGSDEKKNEIVDCEWEGKKLTAREVMQFVGTDIFRKMQKNVWAAATMNKIMSEKPDLAIIADCRFPNEVDVVRKADGVVIKLNRNPFNSDHPSETALDLCNYDHSNFNCTISNSNISINEQNELIKQFLIGVNIL